MNFFIHLLKSSCFLFILSFTTQLCVAETTLYLPAIYAPQNELPYVDVNLLTSVPSELYGGYATTDLTPLFGKDLISSRDGKVYILENNGQFSAELFADFSPQISVATIERGLYSITPHPDVANNRTIFVAHNQIVDADADIYRNVIAKYQLDAENDFKLDMASGQILYTFIDESLNHNGGGLEFGPHDGYLYISMGDDGGPGQDITIAQDLGNPLGKILRIDVDSAEPYAIPADNPFVDDPTALPEVFAYGLRNPWTIEFDSQGNLYIGDVGQEAWEEVNYISAESGGGQNFGWPCLEGFVQYYSCYSTIEDTTYPIFAYEHGYLDTIFGHSIRRCSISGGVVYQGTKHPDLVGKYIVGDLCSGEIWAVWQSNSGQWQNQLIGIRPSHFWSAFRANHAQELIGLSFLTTDIFTID